MRNSLARLTRTLHANERGTAITEFVITLPVFVFMFVAILHLHGISEMGAQGKAAAYSKALEDFREMQTTYVPFDWSVTPITGGGRAALWHNRVSASHPRDRVADLVLDPVPVAGGHMLESWSRIALSGPPSWAAETVELKQPLAFKTMNGLMNGPPSESEVRGGERIGYEYGPSVFAIDLMDDLAGPPGSNGQKSWMGFMNQALNVGGIRPAIAAGMRYGVVEGEYDKTLPWMTRSYTVQQDTHIAAPTRPTSKWISLAIIRMYLANDHAYDHSMLAFEMTVNASDPAAKAAQDCQDKLSNIDVFSVSGVMDSIDVFKGIRDGDPCGTGSDMLGGGNPLAFITGPLSTAATFFGGPVPTQTTTGTVGQSADFP